jgi:N-acetylglutamate synthase-like GNAT family acetyltransferase
MNINLVKACMDNAEELYKMQIITFKPLLEKYQDYDLNPGNEKIEETIARLNEEITDYYIIKLNGNSVGGIRIRRFEEGNLCKVGPLYILPEYQNKGIAQNVFTIIEKEYNPKNGWILDTILQEKVNCHLYEKLGYKKTGKIEKINERMDIVYYEKGRVRI